MCGFWERVASFIISQVICVPFFKWPFQDLRHPTTAYVMANAMNVRITVDERSRREQVGSWFLQPLEKGKQMLPRTSDDQYDEAQIGREGGDHLVGAGETVILYLHGNASTRSQYHRRALYRLFQKMGYYVLAIDYRGYGDSSWLSPSQSSMVEDAKAAYDWIAERSHPSANIFIWGHSLGTGVTSKLGHTIDNAEADQGTVLAKHITNTFSCMYNICIGQRKAQGYVLEAPFNRMEDEVKTFKASRILTLLGLNIGKLLRLADMEFDSARWLLDIQEPIMILHAENDGVIPIRLASKLHEDTKNGSTVQFHTFSASERLGHDGIFLAKTITEIVTSFISTNSINGPKC
jgi:abhydrolase domain-containing protein 12